MVKRLQIATQRQRMPWRVGKSRTGPLDGCQRGSNSSVVVMAGFDEVASACPPRYAAMKGRDATGADRWSFGPGIRPARISREPKMKTKLCIALFVWPFAGCLGRGDAAAQRCAEVD